MTHTSNVTTAHPWAVDASPLLLTASNRLRSSLLSMTPFLSHIQIALCELSTSRSRVLAPYRHKDGMLYGLACAVAQPFIDNGSH